MKETRNESYEPLCDERVLLNRTLGRERPEDPAERASRRSLLNALKAGLRRRGGRARA